MSADAGTIVVADDAAVNRMLLTGILEQAGYDVRTAVDGRDALRLIENEPPDLVLLDVQMPEMSGYEVCSVMRSKPRLAPIPVVFISALDSVDEKVKAFEAGGNDYVTKPFEPAEVLARVSGQVKIFRLNRELRLRNAELQRKNEQLALANQRTERVFVALSEALTNTVLDDTYRLDEKIGEGGFGAVFRGVHLRTQRSVAVKVLRPAMMQNTVEQLARFRREGIAACRITHPNAVEVLDFGVSTTGVPYLVMELLRGRTLATLLRDGRTLSLQRTVEIIAPVCDALAAAHLAGIIHRDVKPDNVFLHHAAEREIVKVVDFGIAKLLDDTPETHESLDVTHASTFVGTPCYTAPERLLGRPYDERSDIYSVGLLLYLALRGELPFATDNPAFPEMVRLHLTTKPRPLTDEAPPAIAALVNQMLDFDPAGRPPLRDVAGALRSSIAAAGAPPC